MKILIATDGSEYSFLAVKRACQWVIQPGSSVVRLISVYRSLASSAAEPLDIAAEQINELENIGRLQSTEHVLRAESIINDHFPDQKIDISFQVLRGSAKKLILKEAETWKADLIIVGSLGHNFLSRMFLGSVSSAMVRHAKCPVLVVRGELPERKE